MRLTRARAERSAVLCGLLVCVALAVDGLAPAAAAEPAMVDASPVVGGFGIGDGLEATIEERDGSARFALQVAGLALTWESGAAAHDRFDLGPGWGLGVTLIDPRGGVRVLPPAGGGPFPVDPTQSSGLAGYGVGDLRFDATPGGVLPARADGLVGELAYEYVLVELGRTTTYFDGSGRPVARVTALGQRADWRWAGADGRSARLISTVSVDGMVTELDWEREPGSVLVRSGANLPVTEADGAAEAGTWRLQLDGGRVVAVEDPLGGRIQFHFDGELLARAASPSGAITEIAWRDDDDRVPRVRRIRTTDATGAELSAREWSPAGAELPSGWPVYGSEGELFFSGDPAFRYRTELSDGATKVRSVYRSLHTLAARDLVVTGGSGERVLRAHEFRYPGDDEGELPDPAALPGNWSRPVSAEITHADAHGATRVTRSEYGVDDVGRIVREVGVDGTLTETEYDPPAPGDTLPPVGLPVRERVTGPDGAVVETTHTLNDARTAVLATETAAGDSAGALTVTARTEFTVEPDGFVCEERAYPSGDATQPPVVTSRRRIVDPARGEREIAETVAVGSDAEATTSVTESLVHGGVVAEVDALGNRATTEYDALGRAVAHVDAAGRVTTVVTQRSGPDGRNAVTTQTPDGVVRTDELDPLGRIERATDNLSGGTPTAGHVRVVERRAYPDPGLVVVTDAWGASVSARQDALGREIETVAATGATTFTEYDEVANTVTTRVSPTRDPARAEHVTVERLDAAGRSIETSGTRADGRDVPGTTASYDGLGRTVATDDGARSTRIEHDVFGDPVRTETTARAPAGSSAKTLTERRFDGFGASLEKTHRGDDDEGAASAGTRELDAQGRVSVERDPVERESRVEYTPDGLVARLVAGSGQITEHTYDLATRQPTGTRTTSATGPEVRVAIERDPLTDLPCAVFDPADRAGTEIRTRYDGFGNPVEVAYPGGRVVRLGYDEHGRRASTTDPAGRVTRLAYDEVGRMVRAVLLDGDSADAAVLAEVEQRYDAFGRVTEVVRGNGVVTAYSYTSLSEIASETTIRGDEIIAAREYEYDPRGRLVERKDRVPDEAPGVPSETTATYAYDGFDRLIRSVTREGAAADAPTTVVEYELTVGGDIRSELVTRTRDGIATTVDREFEYSPLGELLAVTEAGERVTQEYDPAGNLVRAADGTTYEYDAANRPVAETRDGQRTVTTYWPDGTRAQRAGASGAVTFHWDGDELLSEDHLGDQEAGATGTASYLLGAGRHARTLESDAGQRATGYFTTDRHGSVTELTDAAGRSTVRYIYSDYGRTTVLAGDGNADARVGGLQRNPFQYAGGYTDENAHSWLRIRSYDPGSMRFTTMDVADLLNGYHYADLNPIMMVDPSGRTSQWDWTIDAALFGMTAAFAVGMALSALFTGGWSLTALGFAGWIADTVTMAVSAYRVDLAARGEVIDPAVDAALFWGEVVFGVVAAAAFVHTITTLPRAVQLQRADAGLVFVDFAQSQDYRSPLRTIGDWVRRNDGLLNRDIVDAGHRLFTQARTASKSMPGLSPSHEQLVGLALQPSSANVQQIGLAAQGPALTRPVLAPGTARRVAKQANRARMELARRDSRAGLLDYDERRWAEIVGQAGPPADWVPTPRVRLAPRHIDEPAPSWTAEGPPPARGPAGGTSKY